MGFNRQMRFRKRSIKYVAFLTLLSSYVVSAQRSVPEITDALSTPWLTTTFREVVPVGSWNLNAYIFATNNRGQYSGKGRFIKQPDFWVINPGVFFAVGLTEKIDFQITPQWFWNVTEGISGNNIGDLPLGLDIQLVDRCSYAGIPSIMLTILETFPTGSYQNLHPHGELTDQTGVGTYATSIDVVFYQLWVVLRNGSTEGNFLSTSLDLGYTINPALHVKGFNYYGGGYGTDGKVYPGNSFTTIFNFQYSFNQYWVFSLDTTYIYTGKTKFSGELGVLDTGEPASMAYPATQQLTFAPLIEYDFSQSVSLLLGLWFSAWGRNSTSFIGGTFNLDLYY